MRVEVKKSILFSLGAFLFFGIQQLTDWFIVTFSGIRGLPYFIDLRAVLKSSDCERVYGWGIYDPSIAHNCSYIYGSSLVRLLHILNLNETSTYLSGWLLLGFLSLFIGITLAALKINGKANWFVALLVLFSPPTMLLLERANIDILIILLIGIFAYALSANRGLLMFLTLFLASVSKFYTVPIFAWLFLTQGRRSIKLLSISLFILSCIIILIDLSKINGNFPRNSWASFGNTIFGIYFRKIGYELPSLIQDLVGFAMLISTYTAMKFASKLGLISIPKFDISLRTNIFMNCLAQSFALVFLFCYFASVSYDYRLVYLFIPALFMLISCVFEYKTKPFLTVCLVLSAWLSYSSSYLQILGDLAILPWVVVFANSAFVVLAETLRNFKKVKNV